MTEKENPIGFESRQQEAKRMLGVATARPGRVGNTRSRKPALSFTSTPAWRVQVKHLVKWLLIVGTAIVCAGAISGRLM